MQEVIGSTPLFSTKIMAQTNRLNTGIQEFLRRANLGNAITINELKEWDNDGKELNSSQLNALYSFDTFRIKELNSQENEEDFHKRFMELQVMANLYPFEEFLKGDYLLGADE